MTKKFNNSLLIEKIEKLTKQRMAEQPIVELNQFRDVKNKLNPINVLVIEDDETQRSSLKRIIEAEGYYAKMAADSAELTQILDEDHEIHFIIMDVGLPWINGFELAQLIKEHRDLKKIPMIFLSAQANPEDFEKAREVGADDYIKKPFDVEKFRQTMNTLLKK